MIRRAGLLSLSLALCACVNDKSEGNKSKSAGEQTLASAEQGAVAASSPVGQNLSRVATTGCDASLWNHVYEPARLQQLSPCIAVTGTVDESNVDEDGDQHFLIKLGADDQNLLLKKNLTKKSGDLVGEIVCANPTRQKKAKKACAGYTNSIALPTVGARYRVTGTYVIDSHNGWAEIHPVTKLEKM
jgi:hypothetical protein